MTKKWSSTKSMDGQTKRQASKLYRREFVEELRRIQKLPPEATFNNAEELLDYLDPDLDRQKKREVTNKTFTRRFGK